MCHTDKVRTAGIFHGPWHVLLVFWRAKISSQQQELTYWLGRQTFAPPQLCKTREDLACFVGKFDSELATLVRELED